ncbi:MAG: hypothetical protein WKF78_01615 [Candidatus Limnocylindrales bacterium]
MPLQKATNSDSLMTQYEMHAIEALGLLKFDFLGLSNLTILRQAVDLDPGEPRRRRSTSTRSRWTTRPHSSCWPRARRPASSSSSRPGMRRYIRELRPTSVLDLAAMVALYRPGPMDNIPAYIRRKHGQEPVTYLHPLLEPYLAKTYGIFVYQEDIMAAAIAPRRLHRPGGGHPRLRDPQEEVERPARPEGEVRPPGRRARRRAQGHRRRSSRPSSRSSATAFNKAHATCYGLIAYQTAYLKANYTVEYMTAVLTAFRANEEKVAAAVAECRRMGIEVMPPDVHRSRPGVHGRRRCDPVRAARREERRPGRHRVDHRGARRQRRLPVPDRLLHAGRPAPRRTARSSRR